MHTPQHRVAMCTCATNSEAGETLTQRTIEGQAQKMRGPESEGNCSFRFFPVESLPGLLCRGTANLTRTGYRRRFSRNDGARIEDAAWT
jgi:hypothetical protein